MNIRPGCDITKEITLKGSGDYLKDMEIKGDLIIQLKEIKSDRFVRQNRDIYTEEDILLWDALLGSKHLLSYFDKDIFINIDKIIKPQYLMKIDGMGLPENGDLSGGDLIIKFNIIFPDDIPNKNKIRKLVNHPDNDNEGLHINYYKRIDEIDNESGKPQCVHQ